MNQPTLLIVADRRRRGRPTVQEPRSSVSTWLPVSLHDKLIELATKREVSISELVRESIVVTIERTDKRKA